MLPSWVRALVTDSNTTISVLRSVETSADILMLVEAAGRCGVRRILLLGG